MVRPEVAAAKIARAEAWLSDSERLLDGPLEDLLANRQERDLALFYLFLAIQECIDLAAHWVADEGWDPPEDAASTFDVLADRSVITHPLSDTLRAAAGLRNRIAHGYAMLEIKRVRREALDGLPAIRAFLEIVARAAGI